jgi:hypothetical protein
MRNELEEIERIEKYLSNSLNPSELLSFEEELKNNISLQEKVNQQKIVLKGIRKKAFKEVAKLSFKKYKLIKKMWTIAIASSVVAIATAILVLTYNNKEEKEETTPRIEVPSVDSTKVDTVSLAPSPMPMMDSVAPEKPAVKKKEEAKRDTVRNTTKSVKKPTLILEEEKTNSIELMK